MSDDFIQNAIRGAHATAIQAGDLLPFEHGDFTKVRLVLVDDREDPGGRRGSAMLKYDAIRVRWWPGMDPAEAVRVVFHELAHFVVPTHNRRFAVVQMMMAYASGVTFSSARFHEVAALDNDEAANAADRVVKAGISRRLLREYARLGQMLPES